MMKPIFDFAAEERERNDPDAPRSPARRREWNSHPHEQSTLRSDCDEYRRLVNLMRRAMWVGKENTDEFNVWWSRVEALKNKYKGMPPE